MSRAGQDAAVQKKFTGRPIQPSTGVRAGVLEHRHVPSLPKQDDITAAQSCNRVDGKRTPVWNVIKGTQAAFIEMLHHDLRAIR